MTEEKEIKINPVKNEKSEISVISNGKNKVNNKQKGVEVVGGENKTEALKPKASEKDIKQKKPFSNNSGKNSAAVGKPFKKNFHPRRRRPLRPRSEFDQKIIKIRRVTRVVAGGRRFSFSVAMVLGNHKGSVGVAVAKAADTALAIEKAVRMAKKNLIKLKLTTANSIPYDVSAKYCSSIVEIIPAKKGKGLSAGSSVKNVLELAGITDVTAKIKTRSKNKLNIAMATLKALEDFK